MAGKFAPQIWGEASLQLSEFGELERGLPDFSKHVRSGECVKTQNPWGYFTRTIVNNLRQVEKREKNKKLCTCPPPGKFLLLCVGPLIKTPGCLGPWLKTTACDVEYITKPSGREWQEAAETPSWAGDCSCDESSGGSSSIVWRTSSVLILLMLFRR